MNLIFVAPPAAGKGTLSDLLNEKYNLAHISAGQLLRDVDPETEMGKKIREIQSKGLLVDDSITSLLLKQRLQKNDINQGFILDGFPRNMAQVTLLDDICKELELNIDKVIYLTVPFELAVKRTLGRQTCPKCKKTYNKLTGYNTPKVENMCDDCGVELTSRNDDNEESLKIRFDLFNKETYPIVEHYEKLNKVIELDGAQDANVTFKQLEEELGVVND